MAALPPALRRASSTLRERYGIAVFVTAARFRAFMDNLGCVFVLGGVAPAFAVGGKQWGEYVSESASGGSPGPDLQLLLQPLALRLFQAQLDGDFRLQPVRVPRDQNVRARTFCRTRPSPAGKTAGCSLIPPPVGIGAGSAMGPAHQRQAAPRRWPACRPRSESSATASRELCDSEGLRAAARVRPGRVKSSPRPRVASCRASSAPVS